MDTTEPRPVWAVKNLSLSGCSTGCKVMCRDGISRKIIRVGGDGLYPYHLDVPENHGAICITLTVYGTVWLKQGATKFDAMHIIRDSKIAPRRTPRRKPRETY